MKKNIAGYSNRPLAGAVFVFGLTACVLATSLSWADTSVPVPSKKPEVFILESLEDEIQASLVPVPAAKPEQETASTAHTVPLPVSKPEANQREKRTGIQYALGDLSRMLLDYGAPPLPVKKPAFTNEGPLADDQAEQYKKIFALQREGRMDEADKALSDLSDMRLRGHVLYERYMHPTAYTTHFEELNNWLALYADYPGANKIYKLAMRKMPADYKGHIKEPVVTKGVARRRDPTMYAGQTYRPQKRGANVDRKSIKTAAFAAAQSGNVQTADAKIESASELDQVERDILRAQVASDLLYSGYVDAAYALAEKSAKRSGVHVPLAGWVAGLVAWDEGHYKDAARFFEITARSPYASGWKSSAGSYWAARSHTRAGDRRSVKAWLNRTLDYPRTFYGLVATRALGQDFKFNWDVPTFTKQYHEILTSTQAGKRAVALVAAGQNHLAEAELVRVTPKNASMRSALLAYAGYAGLPGLAMRLGSAVSNDEGDYYDAALYPTGPWKPKAGYKVDPALIHAIMRQESRFDPDAESASGAKGLMQLMPSTASYVAGSKGASQLSDPETNLEIGQRYLESLLDDPYVDGNLIYLLIAYNAGPGNLAKWRKRWPDVHDPLMFVELIPSAQARDYVERVLANYWIYRMREDLPTPTLDAIAEGKPARYAGFKADNNIELAARR